MSSLSRSPVNSPPTSLCSLLIADDHPIVRAALRCLLEAEPHINVVAEAVDGEDALAKIAEFGPDVALVDLSMPKLNGIEVVRRLSSSGCKTRILALTAFNDGRHVKQSLAAGAAGFVPKSAAASDLLAAIHAVAAGGNYVDLRKERLEGRIPKTELTVREGEVLRLVARGYTNKEVAAHLAVSVKSVETYKARGLGKIKAGSRVDLMKFASRSGWLPSAPG